MLGILRWLRRDRRGNVALEYGLILPALILFVVGLMETGRLLWTYTTLTRAVEAAARCGAINKTDCGTFAQVQTRAVSESWGLKVTAAAFTVSMPGCGLRVDANYSYVFAIPALFSDKPAGALALKPQACYPINP